MKEVVELVKASELDLTALLGQDLSRIDALAPPSTHRKWLHIDDVGHVEMVEVRASGAWGR